MPNDIFTSLNPNRESPDISQPDALRFDLATSDTASDNELRAAARRISTGLFGVPDPDGRIWNKDRQPFATGADYFRHIKSVAENGAGTAMTPELQAFDAADDVQKLKLARSAMSFGDRTAESAVRLAGNMRPVPTPQELDAAPDEIKAASARMSADAGTLREQANSDYGLRPDGTRKGFGWLGPKKLPDGKVATEYSIGVGLDGKETDIPTLVPTLSGDEVSMLINDIIPNKKPIPETIIRKAVNHAKQMIAQGKSPFVEATSPEQDLKTLETFRNQKADELLISNHRAQLMADNAWAQFMAVKPALSPAAQDLAQSIVQHRKLPATRISDFEALPEDERRALAQLSGLTRPRVPGGFWNTLGDAAIGALNSAIQTPANVVKQVGRLADVADPDDINRRAREEQILKEAVGDPAGFDQISEEHGYLARSFIGAVSTLPYMGYASIPYAGNAIIALDAMQRFEDRVAADGGDITGKDWIATKLIFGSLYAAVEHSQMLPIMRDKGPLDLQLAFVRAFTQRGAGAVGTIAAHVGKTTLEETLEDSTQQAMEEAAVAMGLKRDAFAPAVRGAVQDFVESAGSFGLVSAVGTARMAHAARTNGGAPLADYAGAALRRERLLAQDNPATMPEGAFAQAQESANQVSTFRRAWTTGGRTEQALEASGISKDRAALLHSIFDGEEQGDRAAREIASRNLTVSERMPNEMAVDPETVSTIVQNFGTDAASELQRRGFTPAGASLVANYFQSVSDRQAREYELMQSLASEQSAQWKEGEKSRAENVGSTFGELAPLRDIWAKAQTRDGAVRAFAQSGFSASASEKLADAFESEHALATSPQAAAAFRALYVEGSRVESARDLARRMLPGYDVQDAPDVGTSAYRVTGSTPATRDFSFRVETGADLSALTASESYAASVEEATGGKVPAAQWLAMGPEERRVVVAANGLRTLGDFQIVDEADPSVSADSAGGRVLTGQVRLTDAARAATQFHEIAHGWVAFMRRTGRLTSADIAQLRAKYGHARTSEEAFNEEAFADDFREWLAAKSNPAEKSHLAQFYDAVRGILSTASASEAGRRAAADDRDALFQSIAHGTDFGNIELSKNQKTSNPEPASPNPAPTVQTSKQSEAKLPGQPVSKPITSDLSPLTSPPIPRDGQGRPSWTAATPQGGIKAGGYWQIVPLSDLVTSDREDYEQTLQQRTRGASAASAEQVASIVTAFDATRLFDAPETSNGAPIITQRNHVLSGNGRTAALRMLSDEHRFDEYTGPMTEWAKTHGIEVPKGVENPVLVRVVTRTPAGVSLQKLAALSNRESVLRMTDAEQAGADSELIEGANTADLYQSNADGLPSRRGSDEFFRWFAGATGDASIMDSEGNITDAGRQRARRAMLALAIGRGKNGKDIVRAYVENAADLGLTEPTEALLMSAGALVPLEQMKPLYGLAQEFPQAAASLLNLATQRKAGKQVTVDQHLAQGDLLTQPDAATQELVKLLDSGRSAEDIAAALRRYADMASKIDLQTSDMFGTPPTPKDALLKQAIAETKPGTARYSLAITPQQDAEYLAAIERGDTETAQRMVDEAAKESGYTMGPVYHQTNSEFNTFDWSPRWGSAYFFLSDNRAGGKRSRTVKAYLSGNMLKVSGNEFTDTAAVEKAKKENYSGVIIDHGDRQEFVVFSPEQIKSAEPVTRDDSGRVIPLFERFNAQTPDIRYSVSANAKKLMEMEPVARIEADKFSKSDTDLVTQVAKFFSDKYSDGINRAGLGNVRLTRGGVKSSIAHGIGREKAAAFATVPEVIRDGIEIDRQKNWKGRGYDSSVIAAPIEIGGVPYIAEVIVTSARANGDWMFYLHEVEKKEKLQSVFKTGINTGTPQSSRLIIAKLAANVNSPETKSGEVRYSVDTRGERYSREALLSGFVAHAVMTKSPVPSKTTIERMAQQIGLENWNYAGIVKAGKELAETSVNNAIRTAAGRGGTENAAFAIGELAREAEARALVQSGAREGERLGRNLSTIGRLTEEGVKTAMRAQTGADYSSIERDTGFDIAASILSSDPAKFQTEEEKTAPESNPSDTANLQSADSENPSVPSNENDPDAPGLTDRQRFEIAKRAREREERARALITASMRRGDAIRSRSEEQRNRAAAEKRVAAEEDNAPADAASGDSSANPSDSRSPNSDSPSTAAPVHEFRDKWDFAAFLRVWAYEQWRRLNPGAVKDEQGLAKNRVANEFYRKTAVNELTSLARRLIEPGFPRENIMRHIGEIQQGLSAAQIERRTAHVFGMINAQAIRTEKAKLIDSLKRDIKQTFIKGKEFDELGTDVGRKLRGQIEEDARWIMKVCELSAESVREGKASPLDETRANLNTIISERMGLTGADGEPLPAGESDMELHRALRRLALLDSYGGMVDMMPGEILDLKAEIMDSLERETEELQKRWDAAYEKITALKDPLAEAIMREPDAPMSESGAFGKFIDSLTGMLRLRLDFLTRWADADRREAARVAIDGFMRELADGNTAYAIAIRDDEAKLNAALGRIFVKENGRPDLRAVRAWLKRLDENIPEELAAQLTRQGRQRSMSYGQMLQLLVSIEQPSYAGNVEKHERQGQSALIRTWRGQDAEGKAISAFTSQDEAFVEWLRRDYYTNKRGELSAVMQRLAGRDVKSPDPLYAPVKMQLTRTTPMHMDSGRWEPIAKVFSRRVKNTLDFDEAAHILDMFQSRSRETSLLTAYSERGIILRSVLTDPALQQAITRFHGKAQLRTILQQVEQALNGGRDKDRSERELAAASLAMRATAWTGLGFNVGSAMKQATSIPVFANKIGFHRLLTIMGTAPDREVIRQMRNSDEYRARYGTAPGSGMDIASRQAYEGYDEPARSAMQRFFGDWGLAPMRWMDAATSLWIGQGIYRDLYATNIDSGLDAEEAARRAMSDTWSMVEETQQSGRTENLSSLTRNHGQVGKMLTMFATSPLQQMQYELNAAREWADLRSNGGSREAIREAENRAVRAFVINHVIVPAAMAAVTALVKAATGKDPDWNKDGYAWTLLIAALMGQFSRIFFIGALTEQTLRALFLREKPQLGQLIPAEGVIRTAGNLAWGVRDVTLWNTDKFNADLKLILKSSAVTRIPLDVYDNYFGDGTAGK